MPSFSALVVLASAALAPFAMAEAQNDAQISKFSADAYSLISAQATALRSVGEAIGTALPIDQIQSVAAEVSQDLESVIAAEPTDAAGSSSALSQLVHGTYMFTEQPWETVLPSDVRGAYNTEIGGLVSGIYSLAREDLSAAGRAVSVPRGTGLALGAAAVFVGGAAFLL